LRPAAIDLCSGKAVAVDFLVMAKIPKSVREFLATGPLAHVVSLDPDGTPHITLGWAGFQGDEIVMATFFNPTQKKLENLRRDPRVVLSFQAKEHTGEGLHPYVVIQGRARITDGGALEVMDHLAESYLGLGKKYPMRDVPEGLVVHVTVERIYGLGPWREEIDTA
jgi:PPOX class probable F420-dependent enzyme